MAEPFLGEIRLFAFEFAPRGWAFCDGQLISINQNQALFSLLGTTYGGNGTTTFALPDLRGKAPVHVGNAITLGEQGGEEMHVLTIPEMPAHTHSVVANGSNAELTQVEGNTWAHISSGNSGYGSSLNEIMHSAALSNVGGNEGHSNMQPYLVLNYCIAIQGVYPPRN